jgi:MFS transporter, FSR family, fosmidomycin resistance protein
MVAFTPDAGGAPSRGNERRALGVAGAAHVLHDGYTDLLYLLLPIWQAEFGLGYAQLGMLKSCYVAVMAALQVPASLLAERIGPIIVLAGGTVLAAACFLLAGVSAGVIGLAAALILGGIGASVQHPIGSNIVAGAFHGARSRTALGVYNFTGDLGKVAMPMLAAGLFALMAWRPALWVVAGLGFAVAALVVALAPAKAGAWPARRERQQAAQEEAAPGAAMPLRSRSFKLLLAIGTLDNAARSSFLTFLPFLLQAKGASLTTIAVALSLVLAGGAAGKLVCGYLGAKLGVLRTVLLTEGFTALGMVALLPVPLGATLILLPAVGVALNGTSSVLYGTVPEVIAPAVRSRAFGIFYTGVIGGSAIAAPLMGLVGDAVGIPLTVAAIAAAVLVTIPLTVALNPSLPRYAKA